MHLVRTDLTAMAGACLAVGGRRWASTRLSSWLETRGFIQDDMSSGIWLLQKPRYLRAWPNVICPRGRAIPSSAGCGTLMRWFLDVPQPHFEHHDLASFIFPHRRCRDAVARRKGTARPVLSYGFTYRLNCSSRRPAAVLDRQLRT